MQNKPSKKKFTVSENETINQCLDRMKNEGYTPVRRMEEPVFKETESDGVRDIQPCGRLIIFDGKLTKPEH